MFQNQEIALDELPDMENLEWQQMHSRYVHRMQIERLIFVLIALAVSFVPGIASGGEFSPTVPLWVLVIVVAIPILTWPLLAVPRRGYVVRDKDILFRKGVFWRSVTAVPFNRIQHVETSNTPLDRKFYLATLQLFTAGGSGADLRIEGLGKDVAERLRLFILDKAGASIENR